MKESFKILKDIPINEKKEDRFGFCDIAEVIVSIIEKLPPLFTIGIYGRWGTGKTSICKLIKRKLNNKDDYKVIYFDIWKYEKDSFRRQFLIHLDEELKTKFNLKEKLNQNLTTTDPTLGEVKFDKKILFSKIGKILLLVCAISLLALVLSFLRDELNKEWVRLISSIIFSSTFSGFVLQALVNSIMRVQETITTYRTDSAEGFERWYEKIIKKFKEKKNKKLIVIIDNLDRLSHKKAVDVLSDIKTFLATDKEFEDFENQAKKDSDPIFIIPCDNEAIVTHLKKVYGEDFDADEFLRKFFNLTFRIPKFLDLELDKYILEKLKETNIKEFNNPDLSFVIMQAFRDNPREIIQFINSLMVYYRLAKSRNIESVLSNLPFLAKILVIRQKWPVEYNQIEDKVIRSGETLKEAVEKLDYKKGKVSKLKEFVKEKTKTITSSTIDPFFALFESEYEKQLPESKSFIISCEEMRVKDAEKIYLNIKKKDKISILDKILGDYVRKNKTSNKKINSVFTTLTQIVTSPEELARFSYFLHHFMSDTRISAFPLEYSKDIKYEQILNEKFLSNVSSTLGNKIIDLTLQLFNFQNDNQKLLLGLSTGFFIFKLISKDSIYEKWLKNNEEELINYKKLIISTFEVSNEFDENDLNAKLKKFIEFVEKTKPLNYTIIVAALSAYYNIITQIRQKNIQADRWIVYESMNCLLCVLAKDNIEPSDDFRNTINNIASLIINEYASNQDFNERSTLVKISLKIMKFVDNPNTLMSGILNLFIRDASLDVLKNAIPLQEMKTLVQNEVSIKSTVLSKIYQVPQMIIDYELKEVFNDSEFYDIMSRLINSNQFREIIEISKYINFQMSDQNLKNQLVNTLINKLNNVSADILEKYLKIIYKWGVPANLNFANKLIQIKDQDEERGTIIQRFVKRHKKLFGEPQLKELLK